MFVRIANEPREYAWGSAGEISALLGRTPTGKPEAELWLGAHPGSPSRILDPQLTGGATDLTAWIAADPQTALGPTGGERLPFLLKVLAAASPLSLQAHPNREQAAAGFARENALGIPLDAPERNYRDDQPKPELIYALSETFDALCGFRPAAEVRATISRLIELDAASPERHPAPLHRWLDRMGGDESTASVFEWLISRGEGVDELVERVVELAHAHPIEFALVIELADAYPGDPGIVISLLLNHMTLSRGEALFLPAGNIHAYLRGVGIELMASSDNVLRGGLTPKHVDVAELLGVLDFTPGEVPLLATERVAPGVDVLHPRGCGFALVVLTDGGRLQLEGPAIAVCTEGELAVAGAVSRTRLTPGELLYITPDERVLDASGSGTAFVAIVA